MITASEFEQAVTKTALNLEANPGDALAILMEHTRQEQVGMFKRRYTLSGRDWIRRLDKDDLEAFIRMGLDAMDNGRMGGIARSKNAARNEKGRFIKEGG